MLRSFFWQNKKSQVVTVFLSFILSCIVLFATYLSMTSRLILIYECYALAFWHGTPFVLHAMPYCTDIPLTFAPAFHALPPEYPLLSLLLFSLPLPLISYSYELPFILIMMMIYFLVTCFFIRKTPPTHALSFIILTSIAGLGTLISRYDLIVGACILFAFHFYQADRFKKAYAFLAVGTLLKFIPILFLIPFFLGQIKKVRFTQVFAPIGIFVALCGSLVLLSWTLSPSGTLAPLTYLNARPFEIESVPAFTLLLTPSPQNHLHLCTYNSFGSFNLTVTLTTCAHPDTFVINFLSHVFLLFCLIGLGALLISFLRKKLTLLSTLLCMLLVVFLTGKVFSAQYLLWIIPLVAYSYGSNRLIMTLWMLIALLTACIYPLFWGQVFFIQASPLSFIFLTLFIRDMLLVFFGIYLIVKDARRQSFS